MVPRTLTRNKIRQLSARTRELDDVLAALYHESGANTIDLNASQKQLYEGKNRIHAEVLALKPLARLEDLSIFK